MILPWRFKLERVKGKTSSEAFDEAIKEIPSFDTSDELLQRLARVFFEIGWRAGRKDLGGDGRIG